MNASDKTKFPSARSQLSFTLLAAALVAVANAQTPIAPGELVGPKVAISGDTMNLTVQPSVSGRRYQLQCSDTMATGTWQDLGPVWTGDGNTLVISTPYDPAVPQRFYWLVLDRSPTAPPGFAYIPAGSFQMGDQSNPLVGYAYELPVHSVSVSGFYMGQTEVTKAQWDEARAWGANHGYTDLATGGGKASNHPVHSINWFSMVKWCNARSEKQGLTPCYTVSAAVYRTGSTTPACNWSANGFRLPTEAEWEKAARGGLSAQNFPWGNTITHGQANYDSSSLYSYDISPTRGYHPTYDDDPYPFTSPVGSFAANGYGLYDMAGNVWEWCWDYWFGSYPSTSQNDPRGPASGSDRVFRGGSWINLAVSCRAADRYGDLPPNSINLIGFRLARSSVP